MKNLQRAFSKILPLVIIFILGLPISGLPQQLEESLDIADSLFEAKKYTESFRIYQSIHEVGEEVSPAMLLKMAYIKEGLDDYSNALYYLNLYYIKTNNEKVLAKMKDMAADHSISGYEYTEFEILRNYFFKYFNPILITVFALSALLLAVILFQKFKHKRKASNAAILYVFTLALIFYLVNFSRDNPQGIIETPHAYIMSGPSSGSDVIDIIEEGHRVTILDREDVWLKIRWENHTAYTKVKNVRPLEVR